MALGSRPSKKEGTRVRLYSRHGAEYTDRLPTMVEAFAKLPTQSAIVDGELCLEVEVESGTTA
jgi:ATP-dependent DNA ligase